MEELLVEVLASGTMIALVALMLGNVLLSVIAAIAKKTFSFRNLGDFGLTRVLPMIGYIVMAILSNFADSLVAIEVATYAGLIALYSTGIIAALKSLTGINIPDILSEKKVEGEK